MVGQAVKAAIAGALVIATIATAPLVHADPTDEYGHVPDYSCVLFSSPLESSKQSCVDAFLKEAHMDGLVTSDNLVPSVSGDGLPTATGALVLSWPHLYSHDDQLYWDGLVACWNNGSKMAGDLKARGAVVRIFDHNLTGGRVIAGIDSPADDVPAINLGYIAVGTLCTGGVK
jgi:hypothetical protein